MIMWKWIYKETEKRTWPGKALDNALIVEFWTNDVFLNEAVVSCSDAPTVPPQFTMNRPLGISNFFNFNQVETCLITIKQTGHKWKVKKQYRKQKTNR